MSETGPSIPNTSPTDPNQEVTPEQIQALHDIIAKLTPPLEPEIYTEPQWLQKSDTQRVFVYLESKRTFRPQDDVTVTCVSGEASTISTEIQRPYDKTFDVRQIDFCLLTPQSIAHYDRSVILVDKITGKHYLPDILSREEEFALVGPLIRDTFTQDAFTDILGYLEQCGDNNMVPDSPELDT